MRVLSKDILIITDDFRQNPGYPVFRVHERLNLLYDEINTTEIL